MDPTLTLFTIAAEQGWDDNTMLILCLRYIEAQQANDAFADFLRQVAEEENEATTE